MSLFDELPEDLRKELRNRMNEEITGRKQRYAADEEWHEQDRRTWDKDWDPIPISEPGPSNQNYQRAPEPEPELEPFPEQFSLLLVGRFYAALSVLPYLVVMALLFFAIAYWLVSLIMTDLVEGFSVVFVPFLWSMCFFIPFTLFFLFILRWHGKRRLDFSPEGVTIVSPNERKIFVSWNRLVALELRFSEPKTVQCTLVTPNIRFHFTNLEFNVDGRKSIKELFEKGFELDKLREFLYYLHRRAPHIHWRMSESFKERYKIYYPPYDLDKLQ